MVVVGLPLCGSGGSGVAWFGGCAFGLFGAELQLDFDQVVVAVECCAGKSVDVVDDVAPVFVYNGVVELHEVAVGSFVGVSIARCFLHPALWEAVVL